MPRQLLAAPDKFRGTLSAPAAAAAMALGAADAGWACRRHPLADGGEGTVEALGGANRATVVTGPLGRPVRAEWRLDGELAVIEMAAASGLLVAGGREGNDPLVATTTGTGQLVAAALDAGAARVIVGVGGSASTDGGLGAVEVLEPYAPLDGSGRSQVLVACDVRTRFVDAAAVFGPQKGAVGPVLELLAARLDALVATYLDRFGVDVSAMAGAGAAGGLAGGLAALGARIEPGFDLVAAETGLAAAVEAADLVVTGEGRLDAQSFDGKVVGGVAALAAGAGRALHAIAGDVEPAVAGRLPATSLVATFGVAAAMADTAACVRRATAAVLHALG